RGDHEPCDATDRYLRQGYAQFAGPRYSAGNSPLWNLPDAGRFPGWGARSGEAGTRTRRHLLLRRKFSEVQSERFAGSDLRCVRNRPSRSRPRRAGTTALEFGSSLRIEQRWKAALRYQFEWSTCERANRDPGNSGAWTLRVEETEKGCRGKCRGACRRDLDLQIGLREAAMLTVRSAAPSPAPRPYTHFLRSA